MPITFEYDITKDSFYLEGYKKGIEIGIEKRLKKTKKVIQNMLNKGFDVKMIAETFEVTQKYVKQIQKEIQEKK